MSCSISDTQLYVNMFSFRMNATVYALQYDDNPRQALAKFLLFSYFFTSFVVLCPSDCPL